jgi:hypothetical protein
VVTKKQVAVASLLLHVAGLGGLWLFAGWKVALCVYLIVWATLLERKLEGMGDES